MPSKDPRIDAYIAKANPFAKPIIKYLRGVAHEGCPDCEETLKWGAPAFTHHGIVAIIAAFKAHCAFVLWKDGEVTKDAKSGAMGSLGRITSIDDLPPKKVLVGWVKARAKLNEENKKRPARKPALSAPRQKKPVRVPAELKEALAKNAKARANFDAFSPSHKREYCEWISGAKGEDTRARRVKSAVQTISAGKPQNWKYMKK